MINPIDGSTEPLFKPKEIPEKVRLGLASARALSDAEKTEKKWTAIPDPPTLEEWLEAHSDFVDYDPQDPFSSEQFWIVGEEKAETTQSRALAEPTAGFTNTERLAGIQHTSDAQTLSKTKKHNLRSRTKPAMSTTGSGIGELRDEQEEGVSNIHSLSKIEIHY